MAILGAVREEDEVTPDELRTALVAALSSPEGKVAVGVAIQEWSYTVEGRAALARALLTDSRFQPKITDPTTGTPRPLSVNDAITAVLTRLDDTLRTLDDVRSTQGQSFAGTLTLTPGEST